MHTEPDDVRDVAAALSGDGEGYRRLVQRYQAEIGDQMRRFSRDPAIRDQLTHDVFVEAYLSLHSYRGSAALLHWLRRIAVRVGYRYWTNQKPQKGQSQLSEEDWRQLVAKSPSSGDAAEAAEAIHTLLAKLSPTDRLVITLVHLDGCTMAEVADRTGWTVVGTKVRVFRARNRLRNLLDGEHP